MKIVSNLLQIMVLVSALHGQDSVHVMLPNINTVQGEYISIPIIIDTLGTAVNSIQFKLNYSDTVLRALGVSTETTLMQAWGLPTVSIVPSGTITIGSFGLTPLSGGGDLINLLFEVIGSPGDTSQISFSSFYFNQGSPIATLDTGFVKVQRISKLSVTSNFTEKTFIRMDGITYPTPFTTEWPQNVDFLLGVESPQLIKEHERLVFSSWNDGGVQNHYASLISDSIFIAFFHREFELYVGTNIARLADYLSLSDGGWYDEIANFTLTLGPLPEFLSIGAQKDSVYRFVSWRMDNVFMETTTLSVKMDTCHVVTANYIFDHVVNVRTLASAVLPNNFVLYPNHPNPFNPGTAIKYILSWDSPQMTTIGIYDLRGQLIRRLLNQSQSYGEYQVFWDGLDDEANSMPSGLYFCSICSGNWRSQIKMIKAK